MRRLAITVTIASIIAVLFVIGSATVLSHPVQCDIGNAPHDLGARNVQFASDSGAIVHGWLCEMPHAHAVVLLLPGVRGNRLAMLDRARFLRRAGFSVLLIDFQGTGETKGEHITFGWLESRDVLAAVNFLNRELPGEHVGIIGQSIGGAATILATPQLRVDGVILEQVYPTIERATANRLRKYFGPFGTLGKPLLLMQMKSRLGVSPDQLRPIDHIAALRCPVLVMGGAVDEHTPPEETRAMYDRALAPKRLWLVPGAAHVDLYHLAGAQYEKNVLAFLASALRDK
jgi:alpha-beta hydrolase superfamily lysophospholipase